MDELTSRHIADARRRDLDTPRRTSAHVHRDYRPSGAAAGPFGNEEHGEDFRHQPVSSRDPLLHPDSDRGRVYWLKVHEIPDVGPTGKGKAVVNLVRLQDGEKFAAFLAVRAFDQGGYVFLATRAGIVKKTKLAAFSNPRPSGIIALGVEDEDALIDAVSPRSRTASPGHPRGMASISRGDVLPWAAPLMGQGLVSKKRDEWSPGVVSRGPFSRSPRRSQANRPQEYVSGAGRQGLLTSKQPGATDGRLVSIFAPRRR